MKNDFERRAVPSNPTQRRTRRSFREQVIQPELEPEHDTSKPIRWVQLRILPIWLRILLVLILFVVVAAIGLIVGYSFIGDGDSADALKLGTWQHILDIMSGE